MNKKATRLLSMLLAVLMVVTMIPFMALSAAEVAPVAEEQIKVWNGKVPGTEYSVVDWITGAQKDTAFVLSAWDAFPNDFTRDNTSIHIKSAEGLALFCVLTNRDFTVTGDASWTYTGNNSRKLLVKNRTIYLDDNIYLNDPASAEWNNYFMPLFWENEGFADSPANDPVRKYAYSFTFDGQGHFVYGWQVDQTITYTKANRFNNSWGFFGTLISPSGWDVASGQYHFGYTMLPTVQNFALLGASLTLNATINAWSDDTKLASGEDGVCTVYAGGLIGTSVNTCTVTGCIVDMDMNLTVNGTGCVDNYNLFAGGVLASTYNLKFYKTDGTKSGAHSYSSSTKLTDVLVSSSQTINAGDHGSFAVTSHDWIYGTNGAAKYTNVLTTRYTYTGLGGWRGVSGDVWGHSCNDSVDRYKDTKRGVVTTVNSKPWALDDMTYKDTVFYGVTMESLLTNFAQYKTAYGAEGAVTFDTWNTNDATGMVPTPAAFTDAAVIKAIDAAITGVMKASTPADLLMWAARPAKYTKVELQNDIDMTGVAFSPAKEWNGVFDGQGYAIKNLTSTAQPSPGWITDHAVANMRGGLVNVANGNLTFKDLAILNLDFKAITQSSVAHQGMLWGYTNDKTVTVENVLIMGKNNLAGKSGYEMGMFGGRARSGGTINISNSAFVCTDPATSSFTVGFTGAMKDAWGTYGTATVTNAYAVNIPTQTISGFGTANNAEPRTNATNVYATGAQTREYAYITVDTVKTPLLYKDTGLASFYAAVGEGNEVEKKHMYGDTMGFGDKFATFAASLPVPATLKNAQAISEYITYSGLTVIDTADELDAWAAAYNAGTKTDAVLTADIIYNRPMDVTAGADGLREFVGIKDFTNTFDGNGFTIFGLYQEKTFVSADDKNLAMFETVTGTATIKNLALRGGAVKGATSAESNAEAIIGSTNNRRAVMAVGGLIGTVSAGSAATVTIQNVYIDNAVTGDFNQGASWVNVAAGVGGFIGNIIDAATINATNVEFVGKLATESAPAYGSIYVGAFYGGAYQIGTIILKNAFLVTDILTASSAAYTTGGAHGVVPYGGVYAGCANPDHPSWDLYRYGHTYNNYYGCAKTVAGGWHKYENVYVTSRTQNTKEGYGNNYAYAIKTDGVTLNTQTPAVADDVYPLDWEFFAVDDTKDYVNTAKINYYAVTKQVDALNVTAASCPGLTGYTFKEGAFPVLSMFADTDADVAQRDAIVEDSARWIQMLGASIRLSSNVAGQGIRFSYVVNSGAFDAVEKGYTVTYGALVLPTLLLGDTELTPDHPNAVNYSNAEGADALINALQKDDENSYGNSWNANWVANDSDYTRSFHAAIVNLAGVDGLDALCLDFSVRAYVIVSDAKGNTVATVYSDVLTCSATDVANKYLEIYGDNDLYATQIAVIESMFAGHLGDHAE